MAIPPNEPTNMESFRSAIEAKMIEQNVYYKDLISGNVLQPLKITRVRKGGFNDYMKSIGKLGGQNKVPRLANDRSVVEKLAVFSIQ